METFLTKLKSLPEAILDLILGALGALKRQVSTARGATIFLIVLGILFDIISRGKIGLISEVLSIVTSVVDIAVGAAKAGGGMLIILVIAITVMTSVIIGKK